MFLKLQLMSKLMSLKLPWAFLKDKLFAQVASELLTRWSICLRLHVCILGHLLTNCLPLRLVSVTAVVLALPRHAFESCALFVANSLLHLCLYQAKQVASLRKLYRAGGIGIARAPITTVGKFSTNSKEEIFLKRPLFLFQ